MKRIFKLMLAGAVALLAFASCNDEEDSHDDSYYAARATVTSSDPNFISDGSGGTINFKAEGGAVTLNVSCEIDWTANSSSSDFSTSMTNTTLIVGAEQNTIEQELTGTITLKTADKGVTFATINIIQAAYGAPEIVVETNEWNFPAKGLLTTEIAVEATADWTAESADAWLIVEKAISGIILIVTENEEIKERDTKVTLTCTDGTKATYEYIEVNQDALAYITLDNESLSFDNSAASDEVEVESNYDWNYSYDTTNGWFTVTRNGNILTVNVEDNENDDRTDVVVLTAGDGAENFTEAQLTITQGGFPGMILTYTITSANTTTQLPLYGNVDCTVDWGDGSTLETITTSHPKHTYAATGEYDIIVNGTVSQIYSNGISTNSNPLPLTAVKKWGNTGLTDMQYAFWYCKNLVSLPEHSGDSFANVTSFVYTFAYCYGLEKIPVGLFENCPKATSFYGVFGLCTSLAEIPAGLFDNCPEVNTFNRVFFQNKAIKSIPKGLFDKCPKVKDFENAFVYCSALEEVPEGLFANCPEVTTYYSVFNGCTSLKKIPTDLFGDSPEAENFSLLFYECTNLAEIPAGLFDGCPKATDFSSSFYSSGVSSIPAGLFSNNTKVETFYDAFYKCTNIMEIPKGLFDNCPLVTDFSYVFYETNIPSIPAGLFDYNSEAERFRAAFYNCTNIMEIPEGLFDNCPSVTDFSFVFSGCTGITVIPENLFAYCPEVETFMASFQYLSITEIPAKLFANNKKVTDFQNTFSVCSTISSGESPYDEIDGVRVHLYERTDFPSIYADPIDHVSCFSRCSGLSDYGSIPADWGGGASTSSISINASSDTETTFASEKPIVL